MTMKKVMALLLTATMLTGMLTGCGDKASESAADGKNQESASSASQGSDSATPSSYDGEQVAYISCGDGDPGTLDPLAAMSSSRHVCIMEVCERLFGYTEDGDLYGVLAKDYERDGLTYTVNLYDYITDSAGNQMTASDIVFCLDKMVEKGNTSALNFEKYEATGDYTVEITVNNNNVATFENSIAGLYFVTQAAYEASSDDMSVDPVGTGPYKVDAYETGSTLTLVKNENYWQKPELCKALEQQANTEKIVYSMITEAAQIVVGLETGALDFAFVDFSAAERFGEGGEAANHFCAEAIKTWGGNALFFNMSDKSVFKDNIALRKAVLYGIDRQAIIDGVFEGHAINPKTYGQTRYPDADPNWDNEDYFEYDPDYAKECLKEAGYAPGELSLKLMFPTSSYCNSMAEIIQAYLDMIGIKVEVLSYENALYNSYKTDPTQYDMMFNGSGGPGTITRIWNNQLNKNIYTSDGAYCAGFLNDPHLQELVETASNVDTNSVETTSAVHDYLIDQAYLMQLYVEEKCVVYNTDKIVKMCTNIDARQVPGASIYVWN